MEPEEALTLSARWAGMEFTALLERILASAAKRRPSASAGGAQEAKIALPTGAVGLRIPPGVHVPPPSTIELARLLDVRPGERVLELGCGTGLLAIAAAKLGAGRVVAVDLDGQALDAAVKNAGLNGLSDRIEVRAGSWYEAVKAGERFDVDHRHAAPDARAEALRAALRRRRWGEAPFGRSRGGAGPPRSGTGQALDGGHHDCERPRSDAKAPGAFCEGRCHG